MKIILFLLCLAATQVIKAQNTVHAIFFIDNNDKDISKYSPMDLKMMNDFCDELAHCIGYNYLPQKFENLSFNKQAFENLYKSFTTDESDIIILYVSAHGISSGTVTDSFPRVKLGSDYSSILAQHKKLSNLKHRVLITISDVCNSPLKYRVHKNAHAITIAPDSTKSYPDCMVVNYKTLFLKNKFNLIVTSCTPPEKSIIRENGSVFTFSFIEVMKDFTDRCIHPNLLNMSNVLAETQRRTSSNSKEACDIYSLTKSPQDPVVNCKTQLAYYKFE